MQLSDSSSSSYQHLSLVTCSYVLGGVSESQIICYVRDSSADDDNLTAELCVFVCVSV